MIKPRFSAISDTFESLGSVDKTGKIDSHDGIDKTDRIRRPSLFDRITPSSQ